uniref:Orofacial cleft 1 candidate 1 n=1 Tax=Mastacembelus armatus TaxID=205130 RepID=A0A3Q3NAM3_9TELE
IHLTISLQKLQQKALQQPKQKKSKSAEFLMGEEERDAVVGIENPGFDGGSANLCVPLVWLGREIRGDRPDSTLAASQKKMELQAPAKERGNERAQNYFDPLLAEQTDPRHCRTAGVSTEDELELSITHMHVLMFMSSVDEEVLKVMKGDSVFQQRLLLHGGVNASSSKPRHVHVFAETQAEASAGLEEEAQLEVETMVMGRESTVKLRQSEEVIPHYAQQLRERVRPDMITLGTLSLQQVRATKRKGGTQWKMFCCGVIRLSCCWIRSGTTESKMQVAVNVVSFLCWCGVYVCVCALNSRTMESPSLRALGEGQEEVMATFSQIRELPESSSSVSQPLWQRRSPQPVEVSLRCLRATRDKLPKGLYSVSVALHNCLGGSAMAWCTKKDKQQWSVATEPIEHRGRFYDTDMHINQNLFMILPAACEIIPTMVLIFQLIALPGDASHISSAVAWGAFPVCGPSLCVVPGRFKTPLLRGVPNTQLDQFKKIEGFIASDLDHWLCNLYFQVKRLPSVTSGGAEHGITVLTIPPNSPVTPRPEVHHDQPQDQLPHQPQPTSQLQLCPQPVLPQSQLYHQQQPQAGHSSRAGEPTMIQSHWGSPLHLSAVSACSSSSLPGRGSLAISGNAREKSDPCRGTAEGGILYKKKPIKKTNSCGPSMNGSSAPPRQADKQKMQPSMENLSAEEMEEYTFSLKSALIGPATCHSHLSDRVYLALRMLPSELGLPLPRQQEPHTSWRGSIRQLSLIILLLALMWFVRLYLHYCSQWLYLQAIAVPVNKFEFHTHTVDLVYQSSLLHTREELAMVVVGPMTLNSVTFLLVLIRWGCQQIFGSFPSFTSKFIMAQGVWTVLDPLAVFAVDAVLGRLTYSPDTPVGDAAKLYWHFYRTDQSGAAGVIITVFLYAVLLLLSMTILSIYLLRFHNDGRMLDIFQRLSASDGMYFLPEDQELSNQELSYIVKKAEQWRGFSGERRKVTVYDYICPLEDTSPSSTVTSDDAPREGAPLSEGETCTHVTVYTLYLSGLKQRYRHFLRRPNGAIVEKSRVVKKKNKKTNKKTHQHC